MKILLLPLLTMMLGYNQLPNNILNNGDVTSTLLISGKDNENIDGKYEISKLTSGVIKTSIIQDGNFVIEGTSEKEVKEQIVIGPNFNGSLTIKNLKLFYNDSYYASAPINIDASSNVEIIVDGNNSIRAPQYYPAIGFYGENNTGTLTLSNINDGYLYALGGGNDAAAIGGASKFKANPNSGNIIINSGTYDILSFGTGGPAIGAGAEGGHINKIEINGGTINAEAYGSASMGAAIGCGSSSSVDDIIINGGTIFAAARNKYSNDAKGAAIGAGSYGLVKNIIINGGNITTNTDLGVGIGSGLNYSSSKNIEKIEINGGTIKTTHNFDTVINSIGITDGSNNDVNNIIINGGSIDTKHFSKDVKDKDNNDLTLLKISEVDKLANVSIDGVDYKIDSINEDKSLYLYVTKGNHTVVINDGENDITYNAKYDDSNNSFIIDKEGGDTSLPWEEINAIPVISANDMSVKLNTLFNDDIAKANATAYDEEEHDLTDQIKVIYNDVDTSIIGNYKVTYQVSDSKLATSRKTINVEVYGELTPINNLPVITGEDKVIEVGSVFNDEIAKQGISANDIEDGILTDRIEISKNDVNPNVVGTYHIEFKVEDNDGGVSYLTIEVKVIDKPVINYPVINANDITLNLNDEFNDTIALKGVSATDIEDEDLTDQIKVIKNTVDTSKVGTYEVTYEVKDSDGNVTQKTVNVYVVDNTFDQPETNGLSPLAITLISMGSVSAELGIAIGVYFLFIKKR